MAIIWFDGFDFDTDLLNAGYTLDGNIGQHPSGGRFGGGYISEDGNTYYGATISRPIPSTQEIIVGLAMNNNGFTKFTLPIFSFADVVLEFNNDNSLTLRSSTFNAKTPAGAVPVSGWFQACVKVLLSTTATGLYALYLNGNPTPILTATGLATSNGNATTGVTIAGSGGQSNIYRNAAFDDFYILDGTGPAPFNDALGDLKVVQYVPSAPGRLQQFTNVGGADATTSVKTPDGDTSYTESATVGAIDAYAVTILTGQTLNATPVAVSVSGYARKDDATGRSLAIGLGNGTTENFDGGNFLNSSYAFYTRIFPTNPFTSAPWAQADIAGLQAAAKVIV